MALSENLQHLYYRKDEDAQIGAMAREERGESKVGEAPRVKQRPVGQATREAH